MAKIDIVRRAGKGEFEPSPLQVAKGDIVFWRNLDPTVKHWVTERNAAQDFWFPFPLAPFVHGQPPDTTGELLINGTVDYVCSLHPEEGGQIIVGASPLVV